MKTKTTAKSGIWLLVLMLIAVRGALAGKQQSQSSVSVSSSDEDADVGYRVWPKGGGKVHRDARVAKDAMVDRTSKVGPYVSVEAHAVLRGAILIGANPAQPLRIGRGALVEKSSLSGAISLEEGAKVLQSTVQGPIRIKTGISVKSSMLQAMPGQSVTIDQDMNGQMKMYPEMGQ